MTLTEIEQILEMRNWIIRALICLIVFAIYFLVFGNDGDKKD